MADNRTMAELLQAPTGGFEDAIVIPPFQADNFELKPSLITLVQSNKFYGDGDKTDPYGHIRYFEKITNNFRFQNVPSTTIKLLLFPFLIDGVAKTWLDKEPPQSILTWDDLVSRFLHKFFLLEWKNRLGFRNRYRGTNTGMNKGLCWFKNIQQT
ncbi:hypothetical protein Tco_0903379 [Tanacetum coccineum]